MYITKIYTYYGINLFSLKAFYVALEEIQSNYQNSKKLQINVNIIN